MRSTILSRSNSGAECLFLVLWSLEVLNEVVMPHGSVTPGRAQRL